MECNCINCFNKPICKLCESTDGLQGKYPDAIVVVKECPYYRLSNSTGFETVKNNVKSNYKDALNSLGLGEKKEENNSQVETEIADGEGQICDCCGKLLELKKFQDDVCSKCGASVCVDCAYVVAGKILCEDCF